MTLEVSIITATYTTDRLKDVKQLLDSINSQTKKDFDVFVVVERVPALLDNIINYVSANHYSNMTVLYNEGPGGASANRNLAIQKAPGEIIAFVDDDAMLDREWVDEIIKTFNEDDSVIGVTGPILPLWQTGSMTWVPPEFYWIFSCTNDEEKNKVEVRNGYCTNLAFRKDAFRIAGLFNTQLGVKGRGGKGWQEPGGEETELSLRIKRVTGKRIIYNPKMIVEHRVYAYRLTGNFIARRAYWEGYGKALLNSHFRSSNEEPDVLTTERALFRRIIFYRLPRALKLLFHQPGSAFRQLRLIFTVLTCVAAGYTTYKISNIFRSKKRDEKRNQ